MSLPDTGSLIAHMPNISPVSPGVPATLLSSARAEPDAGAVAFGRGAPSAKAFDVVASRLSLVSPLDAEYTPFPYRLCGCHVLLPPEGPPEFLVQRPGSSADSAHSILTRDGVVKSPDSLRGMHPVRDSSGALCKVVDSTSGGRGIPLIVQDPASGAMSLYDPSSGELRRFPDAFSVAGDTRGRPMSTYATTSADGRFLAAVYGFRTGASCSQAGQRGTRLIVHDMTTGTTLTNQDLPYGVVQLSVDANGCAVLHCGEFGQSVGKNGDSAGTQVTLSGFGDNYRLSPDEQHIISSDYVTANIRLTSRDDGSVITLEHRTPSEHQSPFGPTILAIAFSPGNAMVAVTCNDGALNVFDIANATPGESLKPKLHVPLQHADTRRDTSFAYVAVPWFTPDANEVNAAFTSHQGMRLMNLRLD